MYSSLRPLGGTPTTAAQPTAPMTWSFIDVAAPTSATSSLWRGVLPVEIAPPHLRTGRLRHRRIECPHGNDFWKMAEYKHMRFVHRLYEFPYDHCAPIFRRGGRRRAQSTVTSRSEPAGRPRGDVRVREVRPALFVIRVQVGLGAGLARRRRA